MIKGRSGFTLAELLIALALLGVIAAFTIPKILSATGSKQKVSQVKDAVATLEQSWYSVKQQGLTCTAGACTANGDASGNTTLYDETVGNPGNVAALNFTSTGATVPAVGSPYLTSVCATATYPGFVTLANGLYIGGLATAGSNIASDFGATTVQNKDNVICIDTSPTSNISAIGTTAFIGNFNSMGQMLAANWVANAGNPNLKNFFWGDGTTGDMYTTAGAVGQDAAAGQQVEEELTQ